MNNFLFAASITLVLFSFTANANNAPNVIIKYNEIASANYSKTLKDALELQEAINKFLDSPTEISLEKAKTAWLASRASYNLSEIFHFHNAPVEDVNKTALRLNSWPLDESYIDYVNNNADSGIINDNSIIITKEAIVDINRKTNELHVTTGYHVIEFLLWGQDLSLDSAGRRPASDYADKPANSRRRDYLKNVTELLVDDIKYLANMWDPANDNYAGKILRKDIKNSLAKILTSLATFSSVELSSKRMAEVIESDKMQNEPSSFSDNTNNDYITSIKAVNNVFYNTYDDIHGNSLYGLIKQNNVQLAEDIKQQLLKTTELINNIPRPIDRKVLASKQNSDGFKIMEEAIYSLQKLADLFKEAAKPFNDDSVEVEVVVEIKE